MNTIRAIAPVLLAVGLAAGCAPKTPEATQGAEAGSAETGVVDATIPPAPDLGLPDCTQAEAAWASSEDRKVVDCAIALDLTQQGGTAVVKFAPRAPDAEFGEITVDILVETDQPARASLTERAVYDYSYPVFEDVDLNSRLDVLIPLYTGNVGTAYGLWMQREELSFTRVGEVQGVPVRKFESMLMTQGRSSAASVATDLHVVHLGRLHRVAAAEVIAEDTVGEGESITVTSTVCTVRIRDTEAVFPEEQLTPELVCGLPEVSEVFGPVPQRVVVAEDDPTFEWDPVIP